ncbi:MAG: hypothetical protein PF570_10205 [Candidatus Cloacimonetes bacterium]|nr:hypothetical protein [Candidatus Cloacimonadota bacterium]
MKVFVLILLVLIISCNQPGFTLDFELPVSSLKLNNTFTGISLIENDRDIIVTNISNQLVIEITYNMNGDIKTIYSVIVPNGSIKMGRFDQAMVICTINNVVFY